MPQTGMDWWMVASVIIAALALFIAWRKWRGGGTS